MELLKWWSEFRKDNAVETDWIYRIWNNQEIKINKKPVFYERYFNYGIQTVGDLRFDLNNIDSYEPIAKHIQKTNFLEWAGLRHSVPLVLRSVYHNPDHTALNSSFKTDCGLFDVTFVRKKACFPNNTRKLKCEFNLTDEVLKKAFSLPHSVAFQPYVKAFQFKVLNSILYTNSKLHKIGYLANDLKYVLSANVNQKQCSISFMIVLIRILSGKNLNYTTYL